MFHLFRKKTIEDEMYDGQPVQAEDATISQSIPAETGSAFYMQVEDVFCITGRGTVITGKIESGQVSVGDTVTITPQNAVSYTAQISGVELFRKIVTTAAAGDYVGLLLRNVDRSMIQRNNILTK